MIDFGTVRPGTTLYIPFATYDSNDPTASVTMTGLAVTDIEIYKDGGTTQRASDAGYTLLDTDGIDFDGITGLHGFSISLADNTTAGFYAAGSQYWVVVSSITVDAGTITFIAATFRIGYPDAILNTTIATLASQTSFTLTAGPADDNALVGCVALIHDVASAVQIEMGVVSAYTGSTRTVTLAADPGVFTAAATDNIAFYFPINTRWMAGTALTGRDIGASVLLSSGTGTGQVTLTSGRVNADITHIATAAVSTSTAQLGVNAVQAGGTAWGSGAITAGSIATGAITNAKFAAGAIDAAAVATNAIDADALAADAGTEIGTAVWATAARTLTAATNITSTGGTTVPQTGDTFARLGAPAGASVSADVAAVKAQTAAIEADTGTDGVVVAAASKTGYSLTATTGLGNQTANITGNLSGSIGSVSSGGITSASFAASAITATAIATDAIDADSLAADAVTELNTAVLSAISGIGTAGGAAINIDCATDNVLGGISGVTSGTTFLGTQSSGTYASTSNVNAVYHVITGTASGNTTMDVVYQFLTGAGTNAVQATWVGYVTNVGDTITVSCWRHDTGAWESMTTIAGTSTSGTIQTKNIALFARHRGTSAAELGKVYLRLHCTGMTTPVVGTDQFIVSYAVSSRGTYSDGAVWLNTNASNTNTQSYVDGLPENPVSTIAAAITIATNLNLRRYRVANGSSITLAADHINRTMIGHGYALALGTQNISGSYFEGVEGLSGTGTCPTAEAIFVDCHLNAVTVGEADFIRCHLMNTVTMSQASVPYRFHDCSGITAAKITFSGANQSAVVSHISGVLTIAGMVSTNTLYLDGDADVTFDNTNNTGTVYIAGNIRLTNNGVTMSITDTARWSEDQSVAAVTGAVGSVTGAVGSLATQAKADVNAEVVDVLRTDTLPDSYSAHEAQPTIAQAILAIHQFLYEREVSGTTMTIQKPDGTTTAITVTLDSATNPTTTHRSA